jgi:hypothetical protein
MNQSNFELKINFFGEGGIMKAIIFLPHCELSSCTCGARSIGGNWSSIDLLPTHYWPCSGGCFLRNDDLAESFLVLICLCLARMLQ